MYLSQSKTSNGFRMVRWRQKRNEERKRRRRRRRWWWWWWWWWWWLWWRWWWWWWWWWWSGKISLFPGYSWNMQHTKIFTLFKTKKCDFPFTISHHFFWADIFALSHGLWLLLRKPHLPPPPPHQPLNTLDCSLSILGCQNMLKSRRKSMKEQPEVILTWVEVFATSSVPLGWLFFGAWKDMKSKSHPFRGAVRRDLN